MPYFLVENFRYGVDTRRPAFASEAGSLREGINVHITSGGDVEVRKAFVEYATLPDNTFGLAALAGGLYIFGSGPEPGGMPSGFNYQQLAHPDGADMTAVLDTDTFDGLLYVVGEYDDADAVYHYYDGARVPDWYDGRPRASFSITAGTAGAGNKITAIKVDGVNILGAEVLWTGSHSNTAALVAAAITATTSTPDYRASVTAGTAEVVITTLDPGSASNGLVVQIDVGGDVETNVTSTAMSGGTDEETFVPGRSVRTLGAKMYATSGPNLHYSALNDPSRWQSSDVGAGVTNISNHSSGSEELIAVEAHYERLAIFSESTVQIWQVASDANENARLQTLRGVGLVSARAAVSYLDGATVFLSRQGVKGIQARDSSGRSEITDISAPIDRNLRTFLNGLDATTRSRAILLTEPEEKRLWVIIDDRIYVRSYFPASSVVAWTEYHPGFSIEDAAVVGQQVFVRSGNKVYLYGGTDGLTYDASEAVVSLPYATARAPATYKGLHAFDVGIEGEWTVYLALNPDNLEEAQVAAVLSGQTYDKARVPLAGQSTHVSLKLVHAKAEYARLVNVAFHYKADAAS